MRAHPDELELDLVRTGEADPTQAAHVAACDECQGRLAELTRLADDLAAGPEPAVPPTLERTVLELGRQRARTVRRRRGTLRQLRWAVPVTAAAAAAAVVLLVLPRSETVPVTDAPAGVSMDLTGDGRVDVLDAFGLARAVERGEAPQAGDFTGDGVVDRRDVEAVARAAVRLDGPDPDQATPEGGSR